MNELKDVHSRLSVLFEPRCTSQSDDLGNLKEVASQNVYMPLHCRGHCYEGSIRAGVFPSEEEILRGSNSALGSRENFPQRKTARTNTMVGDVCR
jgi:hypothetical protein